MSVESAVEHLMSIEGNGYSFDRMDHGGHTYCGVSQMAHPNWIGWKILAEYAPDYKDLPVKILKVHVISLYKEHYWDRIQGDELEIYSEKIAFEVFEQAGNLGVRKAIKHLQRSLNVLNLHGNIYSDLFIDGLIGPRTREAYKRYFAYSTPDHITKEKMLLGALNTLQGMYYFKIIEKHPDQSRFRGWFTRVAC